MATDPEFVTYTNDPLIRMDSALWEMQANGTLVDTVLVAGNETVPVHSLVLCARSKFFRRLLQDAVVGRCASSCQRRPSVVFVDSSPEALRSIVKFLYLGEADVPSSALFDFLAIAGKFELDGISSTQKEAEADAVRTERVTPGEGGSSSWTEKPCTSRSLRAKRPVRPSPNRPVKQKRQVERRRNFESSSNGGPKMYPSRSAPQGKKSKAEPLDSSVEALRSHEEPLSSDDESLLNPVSSSGGPSHADPAAGVATVGDDMEAVSSDEENLGVTTSRQLKPSLLESISSDDESRM